MLNDQNYLATLTYKKTRKQKQMILDGTNDDEYKNFINFCYYKRSIYIRCSPLYKNEVKRLGFEWNKHYMVWEQLIYDNDGQTYTLFDEIKYNDLMQIPTVEPVSKHEISDKKHRLGEW